MKPRQDSGPVASCSRQIATRPETADITINGSTGSGKRESLCLVRLVKRGQGKIYWKPEECEALSLTAVPYLSGGTAQPDDAQFDAGHPGVRRARLVLHFVELGAGIKAPPKEPMMRLGGTIDAGGSGRRGLRLGRVEQEHDLIARAHAEAALHTSARTTKEMESDGPRHTHPLRLLRTSDTAKNM